MVYDLEAGIAVVAVAGAEDIVAAEVLPVGLPDFSYHPDIRNIV